MVCRQGDSNAECQVLSLFFSVFFFTLPREHYLSFTEPVLWTTASKHIPRERYRAHSKIALTRLPKVADRFTTKPGPWESETQKWRDENYLLFYFIFFRKIGNTTVLICCCSDPSHFPRTVHTTPYLSAKHTPHTLSIGPLLRRDIHHTLKNNFADYIRHTWAS